jgi:hypothetical protein
MCAVGYGCCQGVGLDVGWRLDGDVEMKFLVEKNNEVSRRGEMWDVGQYNCSSRSERLHSGS